MSGFRVQDIGVYIYLHAKMELLVAFTRLLSTHFLLFKIRASLNTSHKEVKSRISCVETT